MILSLAISSMGRRPHLTRLLESLRGQQYIPEYEVLIGSPFPESRFEEILRQTGVKATCVQVPVKNGLSALRNELYRRASGQFVYFLDEDVELPSNGFIYRLVEVLLRSPRRAVGGGYVNPANPRVFQRAYNSMSNLWLKVHQDSGQALPVAGNVAIPRLTDKESGDDFPFSKRSSFGGEEIHLSENLKARGLQFELQSGFSILHHCEHPPHVFYQRALLHGRSPRQPVRVAPALGPVWRHFREEKSFVVPMLVGSYMMAVWMARAWSGLRPQRQLQ